MRARYITEAEGSIDPTDRGIAYGDGLFETMAIDAGKVLRLPLHLDRLSEGAARLELPLPEQSELSARIAAEAQRHQRGTLKLILTRGTGPRGYAPPAEATPTIILLATASDGEYPLELRLQTLQQRLAENEKLAGIKHLNRLEQVLARLELAAGSADEGLMLSTSDEVIGGTSRNLFAVFGDRLSTPDLRLAGIAGVMRRTVLESAGRLGIETSVSRLSRSELDRANELFMTNALVGIQSVTQLDQTRFESTALADRLREAIAQDDG